MAVPDIRVTAVNDAPIRDRRIVLYWMIAARRARYNFALQRAVDRARELGKPLVVLEALRIGYPWASARMHAFAVQGMADNARAFDAAGVRYLAYVEPEDGRGSGLLEALAHHACVVVTDEWPCFFHPRMVAAAGRKLDVRLEQVDGNGLLPLRAGEEKTRAVDFRRLLQKRLPEHLDAFPAPEPLRTYDVGLAPAPGATHWRFLDRRDLEDPIGLVERLPIDPSVGPASRSGGSAAAATALDRFIAKRLPRYADGRNHPDDEVASGLSPWLHWGHVSAHEIAWRVLDRDGWTPTDVADKATGKRAGWWGASPAAEAFLDELVTWRELAHQYTFRHPTDYDDPATLPGWARRTIADHAEDPRPILYDRADLDRARTHDPVWNAAQRQLVVSGVMHNYLRMLWGKKVLEWSPNVSEAIDRLIHLNNRYALDGRDPNSYSGIFWVFGRFDRAWGPERPIFGKLRYMTSDSTRRKLRMERYLARWGAPPEG